MPGRFSPAAPGPNANAGMTQDERLLDGILGQIKTLFEQRAIKAEAELEKLERKERRISEYDRAAKLEGQVSMNELGRYLETLGFRFRHNSEGAAFKDHYCGRTGEKVDYNAFIADLKRPVGTPLAVVRQGKVESTVKVDDELVRQTVQKLWRAFTESRRDQRESLSAEERR